MVTSFREHFRAISVGKLASILLRRRQSNNRWCLIGRLRLMVGLVISREAACDAW